MDRTGVLLTNGTIRREKYYKDNPEAQQRRNDIRRIAVNIAGCERYCDFWSNFNQQQRATIRAQAAYLYELGVDPIVAMKSEAIEKRGFVYVIHHPAFPDFVKIGRAFNPESRLRGYQTCCPHRRYRIYAAIYFEDCHFAEHEIHARLNECRAAGEWFEITPFLARHTINKLRSLL